VVEDTRRSIYLGPWRVDIVRRAGVQIPLSGAAVARQVQRGLTPAGAPEPASVTVVLTDDAELTDLNREHMGIDGPTDVLSFPMLEPDAFVRDGGPNQRGGAKRRPGKVRTHIGDIAISVERAAEQATEGRGGQTGDVRWSVADELRLLVTHGTLHLCGWDHAEPDEEAAMRSLERRLFEHREG
jgi:probable rRNA maturation factor